MSKITQLPLSSGLKNDTIFVVVHNSGTNLETQQVSASGLLQFISQYVPEIHGGEP